MDTREKILKAAAEMLHRIDQLVPPTGGSRPTVGTFHSTSLRMLRRYADRLGFTKSFAIYDTSDQMTLVRRCMRELQVNDEAFPPRSVLSRISHAKNELIGPVEYEKTNLDFFGERVSEIYRLYQKKLREFDAMDFDDLIGNYVQLLEKHEDVRNGSFGMLFSKQYCRSALFISGFWFCAVTPYFAIGPSPTGCSINTASTAELGSPPSPWPGSSSRSCSSTRPGVAY